MRVRRAVMAVGLGLIVAAAGGCGRAAAGFEPPLAVEAGRYDAVFDASVEVLREMRFVVDRQDRRFGVVTTRPRIASSALEPWHDDHTTAARAVRSTLHLERRSVRVELSPRQADAALDEPWLHELNVTVTTERRYHPPRDLTTAAFGPVRLGRDRRDHRPLITERGLEESYWQPIDRDRHLERRIAAAILRRAAEDDEPGT